MLLGVKDFFCDLSQFHKFPFFFVFRRFLSPVNVHFLFPVPSEQHQRHIQRASIPYFKCFYDRQSRILIFLYGEDGRRFALKLRTDMPTQFNPVRDEMEHTDNTGIVDTGKPVEFVHNGNTLAFIIGRTDQVGYSIDDDQMNSSIPVMIQIDAVFYQLQSLFT